MDLYQISNWLWIIFWGIWLIWGWITTRQRKVVMKGQGGFGPRWWLILIAAIYIVPNYYTRTMSLSLWPHNDAVKGVGLVLELMGLLFAIWARFHLGNLWSGVAALREGHRVVDSGPYRLVRHPIYTGILLGLLGTFFVYCDLLLLMVLLGTGYGLAWKIRAEEKLLTDELGSEYLTYRRHTRMLIPWLL